MLIGQTTGRSLASRLCTWIHRLYLRQRREGVTRLEREPPPNLHWAVVWEMTHKCNLACSYCWQKHDGSSGEDIERGLDNVLRTKPRYLLLTGGEPALVPALSRVVRRIKRECDNPWITLNTNFLRPTALFDDLVDSIDGMHYSLDGLGEGNRINRGFDGERVFRRIVEFVRANQQLHHSIMSVVTVESLDDIPELVETVQREVPGITQCFWPMHPAHHPRSVASDPATARRFVDIMRPLSARYPKVHYDVPSVPEASSGLSLRRRLGILRRFWLHQGLITCHRQFFRADILPDGGIRHCRPHRILPTLDERAQTAVYRNDPVELLRVLYLWRKQVRRTDRYNPLCSAPCQCEGALEPILRARSVGDPGLQAFPMVAGRFTGQQRADAVAFIRQNFNPRFDESFFDAMVPPNRTLGVDAGQATGHVSVASGADESRL
jgi:MoaA/NifB/PqqE/SkfB family radical SAM enzyme